MTKNINQLPPCNFEAEKALIGAIMYNNKVVHKILESRNGKFYGYMFADALHGLIYDEMAGMINVGQVADPITLSTSGLAQNPIVDCLKHNHSPYRYQSNPFNAWLVDLASSAVTIINSVEYSRIIADLYSRRALLNVAEQIHSNIHDHSEGVDDDVVLRTLDEADKALLNIADGAVYTRHSLPLGDHLDEALSQFEKAHKGEGLLGLTTGIEAIDDILGGLNPSDLIVLAGRPSMGKTALALNIATSAAIEFKKNLEADEIVAFYSLEMSGEQLAGRYMTSEAKVDGDKARKGELENDEFMRLVLASQRLKQMPLVIDDEADATVTALRSSARRLKRKHKLGLIVIDYLQLMNGEGRGDNNRVNEISKITRGLKLMAKELEVPVLALSQLSRKVEERENKRPRLPDLRESGSIEQDADVVMFVYRDAYYLEQALRGEEDAEKHALLEQKLIDSKENAEVIIAKNRHGRLGLADCKFISEYSKFTDI